MKTRPTAHRIRALVEEAGSQAAFARRVWGDQAPKHRGKVSNWYHDRRQISTREAQDVARAFGRTVDWLLTGQDAGPVAAALDARDVDPFTRAALDGVLGTLDERLQAHLTYEYRHLSAVAVKVGASLVQRRRLRDRHRILQTYREAGRLVAQCLRAPLTILNATPPTDPPINGPLPQAYVTAAAGAVDIMAPHARGRRARPTAPRAKRR